MRRIGGLVAVVFLFAFRLPGGEASRDLPEGTVLRLRTSSVASFDRALYAVSQSITNMGGLPEGGGGLDAILRSHQANSFLPSFGAQYIQMLTGLAGGEFSPGAGVAIVFFRADDPKEGLQAAVWLPLSNFDQLTAGAHEGRHEHRNIAVSGERKDVLEVRNPALGNAKMYLKKLPGGAAYSGSLRGIDRAAELWGGATPAPLSDRGGFNAVVDGDFTGAGTLDAIAGAMRTPVDAIAGRIAEGGDSDTRARMAAAFLQLALQAKTVHGEMRFASGGELSLTGEVVPVAGTALAKFAANPDNRNLDQAFAAAMPPDAAVVIASAGGAEARASFSFVLARLIGLAGGINEDEFIGDMTEIAGGVLALARGNMALALTPKADMALLFAAADPAEAEGIAGAFSRQSALFAARNDAEKVFVAYGGKPAAVLEAMAGAAGKGGDGQGGARRDVADLYKGMSGGGVFALAVYPADIVKLALVGSLRRQYDNREGPNGTELDIFAAAVYAKLIAAADSGPLATQAVTLSLSSDGERFFGVLRAKSRVMVETMNVYQRLIFALLPEPTQ